MIEAIKPLWDQMPLQLKPLEPVEKGELVNPFTDIFRSAIDAVKETDAEKNQMEYLTATGQIDNPVLLNTAIAKADLAVDLLVQLRSRAMDAYNELSRISL